ncbi:hypothetical protein [Fodinibius halophilus]|uniref:Uncharacterized protein n=1 Tax=Fodinibius halophilus TaxID=1736908 RepID=A0A6M1T751_9BACT|nr:hypothetical protein [Fodinibius halophilus]NGP90017.1 hypothetical protein [Fodinibius halophilus]
MEDSNLSNYSDPELREMIYQKLQRLLSEDTARYRKNMKYHLETLFEAGEIGIPADLLTIKINQIN